MTIEPTQAPADRLKTHCRAFFALVLREAGLELADLELERVVDAAIAAGVELSCSRRPT